MSALQWMEYILNDEWVKGADGDDPGVAGRNYVVPKPQIDIEEDTSNVRFRTTDHVNISDGGDEIHEAMDVGYQHEAVDSFVTITVRTWNGHRTPRTLIDLAESGLRVAVTRTTTPRVTAA